MPTDAVWVIITIPTKEYERQMKKLKTQNIKNNLDDGDDLINAIKLQKDLDKTLEKVLKNTFDDLQIHNVSWVLTQNGNYHQVYFPCELYENDAILHIMKSKGIGTTSDSSIGFIPFNLFFYEEFDDNDDTTDSNYGQSSDGGAQQKKSFNAFKDMTNDFLKSVTSRLTVAQVVEGVRSGAEITFDFWVYTLMAAFICAFAIFNEDSVNIAASMMIEPVMGTVMAMTFGLVIHDKKLFWLGFRNNFLSLLMCLIPGFIIGMIFLIWRVEWNPPNPAGTGIWPTNQMQARGTYEGLIYGVLIALPCGGAVAVSLLNSNYGALVGVAVASTFQPPFVNAGLLWALSTHIQISGLGQTAIPYNVSGEIYMMKPAWAPQTGYTPVYSYDMRYENAYLAIVSMALTYVNVISMLIVAYITLRIKEVMPLNQLEKTAPGSKRFFTHDLRIAREYNKKNSYVDGDEPIGKRILAEWAELSGLDKNQFLSSSPEARITQLQTLFDIAKDVEADETFKRIRQRGVGSGLGISGYSGLARRLTNPIINEYQDPNMDRHNNNALWNIEQELSRAMNRRGHYEGPSDRSRIIDESNDSSPYSTLGRGIRHSDLQAQTGRKRESNLLRHSLRQAKGSPYSVWPSRYNLNRSDTFDLNQRMRHRQPNYPARFDTNIESTGF